MTYKKEAWIAAMKKAVADLKTDKPTSGLPTAIATLRYVRDGVLADHTKASKVIPITAETLKASFSEIITELSKAKGVDDGFASNASAAAKAAGFKTSAETTLELVD
jgi:hypothetical protein